MNLTNITNYEPAKIATFLKSASNQYCCDEDETDFVSSEECKALLEQMLEESGDLHLFLETLAHQNTRFILNTRDEELLNELPLFYEKFGELSAQKQIKLAAFVLEIVKNHKPDPNDGNCFTSDGWLWVMELLEKVSLPPDSEADALKYILLGFMDSPNYEDFDEHISVLKLLARLAATS